jgi:hypothetical protein
MSRLPDAIKAYNIAFGCRIAYLRRDHTVFFGHGLLQVNDRSIGGVSTGPLSPIETRRMDQAMTGIGQFDQFPPANPSGGYQFGQGTSAGTKESRRAFAFFRSVVSNPSVNRS